MAGGKLSLVIDHAKGGTPGENDDKSLMGINDLKGGTPGENDDKSLMGNPDLKDQVTSENSIPLSPQWLYAKPNESKDTRLGTSTDTVQKDTWRLDGTKDKIEWRRSVPDVENNRHWRDEERETSLLTRRERRKDVDRDNEYRKNDHRLDSKIDRETADSKNLPNMERRHDISSRNSTHEGRRDSKWSSRWGPGDKEKDTRADKKVDADKEDHHSAKQSFVGNTRTLTETDSRDKWRPRHRQETQSGNSSIHRAATGYGRAENSNVGFAPGRGRGNFSGNSPPIGAPRINISDIPHGKNVSPYCYPRGKLLDIYRKHRNTPLFHETKAFQESTPVTQEDTLLPLALIKPDEVEGAILEDIAKGNITNSEISHNHYKDRKMIVSDSEVGTGNMVLHNKENTMVTPVEQGGDLNVLNSLDSSYGVLSEAGEVSEICTGDKGHGKKTDEINKGGRPEGSISSSFDVTIKLPDDFNITFDMPISKGALNNGLEDGVVAKEQSVPPEEMSLFYRDPQGEIQGPFLGADIISWYEQGFFGTDLLVCLSDVPDDTHFISLGELMPHLMLNANATAVHNPIGQSEPLDIVRGKLDVSIPASDGSASIASLDKQWISSATDNRFDPLIQSSVSHHNDPLNPPNQRLPISYSEISPGISPFDSQTISNLAEQDAEEVVYTARVASRNENPLGKLANDLRELSKNANDRQYPAHEMVATNSSTQVSSDTDLNPLGLLWSELEVAHAKRPLSSNHGAGSSFSSISDHAHRGHDMWPKNDYKTNIGNSNVLRESMDSSHIARLEQEANHQNILEERIFLQQLQKHQQQQLLQQQQLMSHQNMPSSVPFIEQVQGSLQHQQSFNQPISDLEHLLNLQQQEKHLQQLQQQQLQQHQQLQHQQQLQQQQQLQHQMQLIQQQKNEQQHLQQEQLLLEHMLQQQLQDPGIGSTRSDQILFKQRLLHELQLQQQSHHIPRHNEPSIDEFIQAKFGHHAHQHHEPSIEELLHASYGRHDRHGDLLEQRLRLALQQEQLTHSRNAALLPIEQQFLRLGLQQEQMQSQQYPQSSSQHLDIEKDRNAGVWSVDESGQFIRTSSSSGRPHLDFSQPPRRLMSVDQPRQIERNIFQENQNLQSFDRKGSMHGSDVDFVNALARFQGLDASDMHNVPNQFTDMHLDALGSHWPERSGQLSNSLVEPHISQLQHEVERHKRHTNANLSGRYPNSWASSMNNDENFNRGLTDTIRHDATMAGAATVSAQPSYENRDISWPFARSASDHSFNFNADEVGLSDSFRESSLYNQLGNARHDRMVPDLGKYSSSASLENNQNYQDVGDNVKELSEYVGAHNTFDHNVDPLDSLDGNIMRKHSSKGKLNRADSILSAESGIEQTISSAMSHGDLEVNPIGSHGSFGNSGGPSFYNDVMGTGNTYSRDLANHKVPGILPVGQDQIKILSSQSAASSSVPSSTKGKNLPAFPPSEGGPPIKSNKNTAPRHRQTSSSSDAPQEASSFIDMLKSTKKVASRPPHESEFSNESHDGAAGGGGVKGSSSKKKSKKGRQIDPSLLGFKVHSNRFLMGEIQRPEE